MEKDGAVIRTAIKGPVRTDYEVCGIHSAGGDIEVNDNFIGPGCRIDLKERAAIVAVSATVAATVEGRAVNIAVVARNQGGGRGSVGGGRVNGVVLENLILHSVFVDSEQNSGAQRATHAGIAIKLAVRSLDEPVRSGPIRVGFRFSGSKFIEGCECARRCQ